jgi:predicted anti-sigma-YlaC factor YlaD
MFGRMCEREPEMLDAAARGGTPAGPAAAHLASCASCRDAVAAAAWMRDLAGAPHDASRPLPDPAVIWWKAQLMRRWESERRAVAPMERMHWIELAAGIASLGVFLVWQWSGLVNLLAWLNPARLAAISSSANAAGPSMLLLGLGATVALGATIFASLHRMITHD